MVRRERERERETTTDQWYRMGEYPVITGGGCVGFQYPLSVRIHNSSTEKQLCIIISVN